MPDIVSLVTIGLRARLAKVSAVIPAALVEDFCEVLEAYTLSRRPTAGRTLVADPKPSTIRSRKTREKKNAIS